MKRWVYVISAFLLLFGTISLPNRGFAETAQEAGASYWNFEEASGAANDVWGTRTPAADLGSGVQRVSTDSIACKSVQFNGLTGQSGSYIHMNKPDIVGPWTVAMWVKKDVIADTNSTLMGSPSYRLKIEQFQTSKNVGFTRNGVASYSFDYVAPVGAWTHLTFVGDSTGTALYVNGKFQDKNPNVISLPMGTIGADSTTATGGLFKGKLDEIKVFTRVLSDSEIAQLPGVDFSVLDLTPPVLTLNGNEVETVELNGTYVEKGATAIDNKDGDISASITVTGAVYTDRIGSYTLTYKSTDSSNNWTQKTRTVNVVSAKTLSRASRVLIDKGLQLGIWTTGDEDHRYHMDPQDWNDLGFTTPQFYDGDGYDPTLMAALPSKDWALSFSQQSGQVPPIGSDYLNMIQKQHSDHLVFVSLEDEEPYSQLLVDRYKQIIDYSHENYPNTLVYGNQYMGQWTESQLSSWTQNAKPDILTFDEYYYSTNTAPYAGGSVTKLYNELGKYRKVALGGYDGTDASPIAFGQYLLGYKTGDCPSCSPAKDLSNAYVLTESELNLIPYATWTFGGKWTSIFRWGQDKWWTLLLDSNGNRTQTYYQYAAVANTARHLSPYLTRLTSKDVRMIPGQYKQVNGSIASTNVPSYVKKWDNAASSYIKSISAQNIGVVNDQLPGDVVIGFFESLPETQSFFPSENSEFFMVLNGLTQGTGRPVGEQFGSGVETRQQITMDLDLSEYDPKSLKRISSETGQAEQVDLTPLGKGQYRLSFDLDGGVADLFMIDKTTAIDSTPPVTMVTTDGVSGDSAWNNHDVHLSFTANDGEEGSGIYRIETRIDGGEWMNLTDITLASDGMHTIEYRAIDNAGNVEATKQLTVGIDKTAPSISAPSSLTWLYTEAMNVNVDVVDVDSGVANVIAKLDGIDVKLPYVATPVTLPLGMHIFEVAATDHAGNVSSHSVTLQVTMDVEHLDDLLKYGYQSGLIDNHGILNNLLSKVTELAPLRNEIKAQSGKHIEVSFADQLLGVIDYLQK